MQYCPTNGMNMQNIWAEPNYYIGRIIMYTNCCNNPPNVSISSTFTSICNGSSTTLNATFNSGGTYSWSNGSTNSSINVLLHPPLLTL